MKTSSHLTKTNKIEFAFTLPLLIALSLIVGCSKETPRYALEGRVTLDGEPLDGVVIVFASRTRGEAGTASSVSHGSFAIDASCGVAPGQYDVYFTSRQPEFEEFISIQTTAEENPLYSERIPIRYTKPNQLQAVVSNTMNRFQFDLVGTSQ